MYQKLLKMLNCSGVDSAEEVSVNTSRLTERSASKDGLLNYEYPPRFRPSKRESNYTCYGLQIRCKPVLNRKLNVHLSVHPKTNERSYVWSWESSIFVDGKYQCPAVLLENNLLLGSEECGKDIEYELFSTIVYTVSRQSNN